MKQFRTPWGCHNHLAVGKDSGINAKFQQCTLSKLPGQSMVNKTGAVIRPSPNRLGFETDSGSDCVNSVAKCDFGF